MDSTPFYLSYAALWVLIILHSLVLLGVVRIVYQLQQDGTISREAGMNAGQEAPEFSAIDLTSKPINSVDFAGRLTALLFVSPNCLACKTVLQDDIEYLQHKAQGNVIVICQGESEDCRRLAEQYELKVSVVADEDEQINQLYNIASVPTTVLIQNNRIKSYGQPNQKELDRIFNREPEIEILKEG